MEKPSPLNAPLKRELGIFSNFLRGFYTMREMWFLVLAVALATVTTFLANLSQNFEFSVGVAFIGYSAASVLSLIAVFGD